MCAEKQQVRILYPATFNKKSLSKNTYSARRNPDGIHYRILKCMRCGLVFSSPILDPERMSVLYGRSSCNYQDQVPYLIRTYFNIVNKIQHDLPKNPKVLEVGCGNGFFLKALKDMKFTKNIFGVEPSSKMALEADSALRSKIKINIFKLNLFPKNSFNLILCFHTLDHMFNPKEFVEGAHSMLRKNGYVVVVVHDTEGLSVKMFRENSPIFDIEHIYLFNKKTLSEIFLRHKFEIIKVFNVVNNYPLDYWIQMSGFPYIVKKYTKFVFNRLGIGKKGVSIPAGNIALIAKKNV